MASYVDDMRAPYGRLVMCHLVADSTEELLAMADRIGVARRWLQQAGRPHEHFDICLAKRRLALKAGAREVTWRALAVMVHRRVPGMPLDPAIKKEEPPVRRRSTPPREVPCVDIAPQIETVATVESTAPGGAPAMRGYKP